MNSVNRKLAGDGRKEHPRLRRLSKVVALSSVVVLLSATMAWADNVQNDVDASGIKTITAGGSTTISYRISGTGGDGGPSGSGPQGNCNAADGTPATVTIVAPTAVTVSDPSPSPTATPKTILFSSCGNYQARTFSATEPGNYPITVTVADAGSTATAGTYTTIQAAFTLKVLAPSDTTPPTAAPTQNPLPVPGSNGWNNGNVTVSWNWTDNAGGSGIDNANCTKSSVSTGEGIQTLNATCKDLAGNTGNASYEVKVDTTAPAVTATASPAANGDGWNNTNVTVEFTGTDVGGSGIDSCTLPITLTSEGAGQSASGTCTDKVGNQAGTTLSGINIDMTAPTAMPSASPAANLNGWNKDDVTVTWNWKDNVGGSGTDDCTTSSTSTGEGILTLEDTCSDLADNSSDSSRTVKVDKTAPTVSLLGGPADGASYPWGSVPSAPMCSASDNAGGSGIDGNCAVSGYSTSVGSHTVKANASDKAGNAADEASAAYTVNAWTLNGFFSPVDMGFMNTVKGGSTVPLKFRVFAGADELTATSAILSHNATQVTCATGLDPAPVEELAATGGTILRYDTTSQHFIYNWKTPKMPGKCYKVTVTTQDGSKIEALFKLT